jgi:hypothetical protein
MTAAAAARVVSGPSALDVFIARSEGRALLWQCGELSLHEAVDALQHAAERDGLVALIGQDKCSASWRTRFEKFASSDT